MSDSVFFDDSEINEAEQRELLFKKELEKEAQSLERQGYLDGFDFAVDQSFAFSDCD